MKLPVRAAAAVALILAITGCAQKSGEGVIVSKEHIEKGSPSTRTESTPSAVSGEPRPMADDEIAVDGYVMKRDVRGTSKDPRALTSEQWLLKVRMTENGREFNVPTEQKRWDKLKSGDRVKVKYSQGNYTGTILGRGDRRWLIEGVGRWRPVEASRTRPAFAGLRLGKQARPSRARG